MDGCEGNEKHLECPFSVSWGGGEPGARAATSNQGRVALGHLVTLDLPPDVHTCPARRDRCAFFLLEAEKPSQPGEPATKPHLHASSPDASPFPVGSHRTWPMRVWLLLSHLSWQHSQPFLVMSNASSRHASLHYWLSRCLWNHRAGPSLPGADKHANSYMQTSIRLQPPSHKD